MKLAVVLVHFHTPDLLRDACEALLDDAGASAVDLEGLVVDNGSRPRDGDILRSLPFRCLDPGRNLGYAGGVNLGLRETGAEHVVVMNPDVRVLPGCLAALVASLRDGAAAAGPRFYWDEGQRFLLPPTEAVSRRAELLRVLAARGGHWAKRGRRAWRRHARRFWLARSPLCDPHLSGALLAIRRDAWRRVGPFDEAYRLYFEETDWLQRLRAARLEARFVPAAEAVHLYDQSTRHEDRTAAWFLESSRRFRRRRYGRAFSALLERLDRAAAGPREVASGRRPQRAPRRLAVRRSAPRWLEVSAAPIGYPAAGRKLAQPPAGGGLGELVPAEIRGRLAPGTYFLRTVDGSGRDLEAESFVIS